MTPKTLKALKASIRHWEENVAAEAPKAAGIWAKACALCCLYIESECRGCPVYERARTSHCRNTPYYDARVALANWRYKSDSTEARDAWRKAARAELDFLRSLLPLEQAKEKAK